jgi:hypothetical protein
MRFRRSTRTVPGVNRQPGHIATVLLVLLTVLTGARSPFPGQFTGPPDAFPSPGELAAAARRSGYLGVVAQRPGALTPGQVLQAALRRERLTVAQRSRLDDLLAAASPAAQGYLAQAFAAGHGLPEIAALGAVIGGHGPRWLRHRLRPVDSGGAGPVQFRGASISQVDDTTCGSTTIVAARALIDPVYALHLTTGGRPGTAEESDGRFRRRLRVEEQRVHDETGLLWPQRAGTPPWGISDLLNRDPADLGAHYRWTAVVPGVPALADSVVRRALTAADRGYPVPILLGDLIPRHYVLLLRRDGWGASFYEPTAGEVVVVPTRDLERRDFSELGYARLHGAILPSAPTAR